MNSRNLWASIPFGARAFTLPTKQNHCRELLIGARTASGRLTAIRCSNAFFRDRLPSASSMVSELTPDSEPIPSDSESLLFSQKSWPLFPGQSASLRTYPSRCFCSVSRRVFSMLRLVADLDFALRVIIPQTRSIPHWLYTCIGPTHFKPSATCSN